MSKGQHMTNFYCFFCHSCFQNMFYTWCLGRNKPRSINAMCFLNLSTTLKVVSTTFGPITIFKQQSLLFHLLHKITFSSLSTTSFASLVFIAFVLQILRQEIVEVNTILKNNIIVGIILMTYTHALARTRFYIDDSLF